MLTTDLLLSPFGADGPEMVEAARVTEQAGYGGVWTLDHFSGSMVQRPWSREPFTILGAIATATSRIRIGPLVANVVNRHPALLTSAAATLQSLSGGRAVLGLGAGAAPGATFAVLEHTPLFSVAPYLRPYDVTGDGRFVMVRASAVGQLIVVENWFEELKENRR